MSKKYVMRRKILERCFLVTLGIFIFSLCGIVGNIESSIPVIKELFFVSIISGGLVTLLTPIINRIIELENM